MKSDTTILNSDRYNEKCDLKLTLFYSAIILFNLATVQSSAGFLLTLIEFAYVMSLLLKKRIGDALFWHTVFTITCISALGASGMDFDNTVMYSYARLKVVGPVGLSYLVSIAILILSINKRPAISRKSLFYKMTVLVAFLFCGGLTIGIVGVLLSDYYLSYLIEHSVFSIMVLINCVCFIKNGDNRLIEKIYHHSIPLLVASCISTLIGFSFMGLKTSYGGLDDTVLSPDLVYYGTLLFFLVLVKKRDLIVTIGLVSFIGILILSASGKVIYGVVIALCFILYYTAFSRTSVYSGIVKRSYVISLLVILIIGGWYITNHIEEQLMGTMKIEQAFSMFSELANLSDMAASPYIRVAEFLNIVDNGLSSPFFLLFGHGYGGYFTDSLHLLSQIDLSNASAFSDEVLARNQFPNAHDTIVVVPLLNGFVGLFALLAVVIKYVKKIKYSPYAFTAVLWLLLVYYFNTQLAITGIFFLIAAEFNLKNRYSIRQ